MFKAIKRWWQNMRNEPAPWEPIPEAEPVSRVPTFETIGKRGKDQSWFDYISSIIRDDVSKVLVLKLEYKKYNSVYRYISRYDGKDYRMYEISLSDIVGMTNEGKLTKSWGKDTHLMSEEVSYHWDLYEYGTDIPEVSMGIAKDTLAKAPPYVALPFDNFKDIFVTSVTKDMITFKCSDVENKSFAVSTWLLDTLKHLNINPLVLDIEGSPYLVLDEDLVDKEYLHITNPRKWITVEEVDFATNQWVIRAVPRVNGGGKIRYYNIRIDFNKADMEKVSINAGMLIKAALEQVYDKCKECMVAPLPVCVYPRAPVTPPCANLFFKIENLYVTYMDTKLSFTEYVSKQSDLAFQETHPYFNPNVSAFLSDDIEFSVSGSYVVKLKNKLAEK